MTGGGGSYTKISDIKSIKSERDHRILEVKYATVSTLKRARLLLIKKVRIGDWEAGTVIGKGHKDVLVTLSER